MIMSGSPSTIYPDCHPSSSLTYTPCTRGHFVPSGYNVRFTCPLSTLNAFAVCGKMCALFGENNVHLSTWFMNYNEKNFMPKYLHFHFQSFHLQHTTSAC